MAVTTDMHLREKELRKGNNLKGNPAILHIKVCLQVLLSSTASGEKKVE